MSPALAGRFFTTSTTWAHCRIDYVNLNSCPNWPESRDSKSYTKAQAYNHNTFSFSLTGNSPSVRNKSWKFSGWSEPHTLYDQELMMSRHCVWEYRTHSMCCKALLECYLLKEATLTMCLSYQHCQPIFPYLLFPSYLSPSFVIYDLLLLLFSMSFLTLYYKPSKDRESYLFCSLRYPGCLDTAQYTKNAPSNYFCVNQ